MLCGAHSAASDLVSWCTAALLEEYAVWDEPGRYAAPLTVMTMRPRPRSSMPGITERQDR